MFNGAICPIFVRIGILLSIAFVVSRNRSALSVRTIVASFALQNLIAFIFFKTTAGISLGSRIISGFGILQDCIAKGGTYMFGNLFNASMQWGVIFAVQVVPVMLFFSALTSVLYYFRIIQYCVWGCAKVLSPLFGISGVESLSTISNAFLTAPEIPLLIRHYLSKLTVSEMFVVMVSGLATLSASFLPIHAILGVNPDYILASNCMAIAGSIVIAKIMIPETETSELGTNCILKINSPHDRVTDAFVFGARSGLKVIGSALASLVSIISLIALINALVAWFTGSTLEQLSLPVFSQFARLLGVRAVDLEIASVVLAKKFFIHELVAYKYLVASSVTYHTKIILFVALSGFASLPSAGILMGVIGTLEPSKRMMVSKLLLSSILAGTLVTYLNALIVQLYI